jgi:hypothetical protein
VMAPAEAGGASAASAAATMTSRRIPIPPRACWTSRRGSYDGTQAREHVSGLARREMGM